jgi:predicted transcriptional regulator
MKPSDDLKQEIYKGKDAQTVSEIAKEVGRSYSAVRCQAVKMVELGRWKQVFVKAKYRGLEKAYIKVK